MVFIFLDISDYLRDYINFGINLIYADPPSGAKTNDDTP